MCCRLTPTAVHAVRALCTVLGPVYCNAGKCANSAASCLLGFASLAAGFCAACGVAPLAGDLLRTPAAAAAAAAPLVLMLGVAVKEGSGRGGSCVSSVVLMLTALRPDD